MKAWTVEALTAEGTMRLADLPDPVAGPGQYVVAVEAAGLNFLDVLMLRGQYQTKPPLPFTPGVEAVGRIAACGRRHRPAGRHAGAASGQGAYAERIVVAARRRRRHPGRHPRGGGGVAVRHRLRHGLARAA